MKSKYPTHVCVYELGFSDGMRDADKTRSTVGPASGEHAYLNGYHAGYIFFDTMIRGIGWQHYDNVPVPIDRYINV